MTEHRFRDPEGNEWVTITEPTQEILDSYPEGTVEIPMVAIPLPEELTDEQKRALLPALTAREIRLALIRSGIPLMTISTAISAMPEGQEKEETQVEWEYATEFKRLSPTLLRIAASMQLSPETVDSLWQVGLDIREGD